jgi:hypothetical protein
MTKRRILSIVILTSVVLGLTACTLLQPPEGDVEPDAGMEGAIDVVTEQVLPDAVPEGATYNCLRMDEPIPPGSVVEEDAPAGASTQSVVSPKAITVGEESFFFFLDLGPGTYYEHPVKYILVSKNGGYQVMDAKWWPKINGETPAQFVDDDPDPDYIIAGNATFSPGTGMVMEFDFLRRVLQAREGFIIVQGLMPAENLYSDAVATYMNGVNFFNAYKSTYSVLDGLVQGQADNVLDKIDDMVADKLNPITIYIIAHGGVDGVSLGGVWVTAQSFRNKMAAHPSTLFNFLLGSCHSGSFMDNLETLDNVRVIQTACTSEGGATPDWDNAGGLTDYNTEDSGSEWTSSVLRAAEIIVGDSAKWTEIQNLASTYSVPVTSVLLDVAGRGALGNYSSLGLTQNLDLSNRTGHTEPQIYRSWGLLWLVPIIPFL